MEEMRNLYNSMKEAYYNGFPISKDEKKKIHDWLKNHEDKLHGGYPAYHGASGGGYVYKFYPSAIGRAGEIVCSSCSRKAFKESLGDWNEYQELLKEYDGVFEFQDLY